MLFFGGSAPYLAKYAAGHSNPLNIWPKMAYLVHNNEFYAILYMPDSIPGASYRLDLPKP